MTRYRSSSNSVKTMTSWSSLRQARNRRRGIGLVFGTEDRIGIRLLGSAGSIICGVSGFIMNPSYHNLETL